MALYQQIRFKKMSINDRNNTDWSLWCFALLFYLLCFSNGECFTGNNREPGILKFSFQCKKKGPFSGCTVQYCIDNLCHVIALLSSWGQHRSQ